jgi:hypothetical protein
MVMSFGRSKISFQNIEKETCEHLPGAKRRRDDDDPSASPAVEYLKSFTQNRIQSSVLTVRISRSGLLSFSSAIQRK